ncbi:reverse transcriptase-like protein [Metabacillus herbersteinensis]|uniref:Reverse transcriptase-like protein n=1 Tax=Metabacillus herbersteinensis TaxID=283816 RepID=A0ABV6GDD5_9BACI
MIEWTYQTKRKHKTILSSQFLSLAEVILFAEDFEKTGRVNELNFSSEDGQLWTLKELKKLQTIIVHEPYDVVAYFDGGFQKETLISGLGVVIYYTLNNKRMRVRLNEKVQELTSNNEAEYAAFSFMISQFEELGISRQSVTFKGDSQVVLNQLSGEWPCYEEVFLSWLDKIEKKIKVLKITPKYQPISRKLNEEADKLASQAINDIRIRSQIQVDEEVDSDEKG